MSVTYRSVILLVINWQKHKSELYYGDDKCRFIFVCSEHFHTELLHQLRCCFEQTWQNRLAEVERCKVNVFG